MAQALLGSQVPRIRVVPDGVDHPRWSEVEDFVGRLGVVLDPWQWDVLRVSLMRTEDLARWSAFAVGVCAPRQNGKNGILEIRELAGAVLLDERLIVHTAHLADTSKEGFRRLDDLIDANAWLSSLVKHIWRTNGHESIEFTNGNRIRFRTRTRGGGRGLSGSPVIFDEPMFLPEISMGSILPVISAQPDPQIWYTGSAVDQTIHEDGVVFAKVRERALSGTDPRLAYFEWSLDAESPDRVGADQAVDPEVWAATNPALGFRISPDYVMAEQRELAARTFAVERLGVGDWPDTDRTEGSVINLADWQGLVDVSSEIVGAVCFGFEVKADRSSAAIGAAGARDDGLLHAEVIEYRPGTGWVVDRLVDLLESHDTAGVFCGSASPAASLADKLEARGVTVTMLNAREYANACGSVFDMVEQERLRHLGSPEMDVAVRGAKSRAFGDGWMWSHRHSPVDISPLVAVTAALSGAAAEMGDAGFEWASDDCPHCGKDISSASDVSDHCPHCLAWIGEEVAA